VRLAFIAARNGDPSQESNELVPPRGLKIATSLSRSRARAELNDEGAKISSRVGSRSRDCGTVGDRAACSYRAERWETAAFVEFRGYASVGLRACGNCHSNHTDWLWYSHVAPVSWWIAQHVREGREKLDFSDWEDIHGKSVTNWIPCADSYRRAGCRHGCAPQCIQRRNLLKKIRKQSVPG
jgi:hypothetical protein